MIKSLATVSLLTCLSAPGVAASESPKTSVSLSHAATPAARAGLPFDVAIDAVQRLYLQPLEISDAVIELKTAPFGIDCAPDELSVRVLRENTPDVLTEILKVVVIVIAGRVQFLSANGDLLGQSVSAAQRASVLDYLSKVNGWLVAGEMRRGVKQGLSEIDLRDPRSPANYISETRTVVFNDATNLPVMIGSPARPAGFCAPLE
jgi:hypothetical protein